jgi:hypothetical protein
MTDYAKGYPQIVQNIEIAGVAAVIISTAICFLKLKFLLKH